MTFTSSEEICDDDCRLERFYMEMKQIEESGIVKDSALSDIFTYPELDMLIRIFGLVLIFAQALIFATALLAEIYKFDYWSSIYEKKKKSLTSTAIETTDPLINQKEPKSQKRVIIRDMELEIWRDLVEEFQDRELKNIEVLLQNQNERFKLLLKSAAGSGKTVKKSKRSKKTNRSSKKEVANKKPKKNIEDVPKKNAEKKVSKKPIISKEKSSMKPPNKPSGKSQKTVKFADEAKTQTMSVEEPKSKIVPKKSVMKSLDDTQNSMDEAPATSIMKKKKKKKEDASLPPSEPGIVPKPPRDYHKMELKKLEDELSDGFMDDIMRKSKRKRRMKEQRDNETS